MDNRDRGFTLIEVMIAMAVATVMFLGIMDMITAQNKAVRGTQNVSSSTGLQNLITQIIDNPNTCSALFNGISWKSPLPENLGTQWSPSTTSFTLTGGLIQAVSWAWSPTATNVTYGSYLNIPEPSTQYPLLTNLACPNGCTAPYTITGNFTLWPTGVGGNTSATGAGAVPMQIQVPFQAQLVPGGLGYMVGTTAGQCGASTSVGTGTQNILAKWTSGTQLGNSNVEETGTNLLTVGTGSAENTTMNGTLTVTSTSNPALTMSGSIALAQSTTTYKTGAACTPEGTIAYDMSDHLPVFCNHTKVWAGFGATITMSGTTAAFSGGPGCVTHTGLRSLASWTLLTSVVPVTAGVSPPNKICIAVPVTGGGGDTGGASGCYYDSSTGNIYGCSFNSYNVCQWYCLN